MFNFTTQTVYNKIDVATAALVKSGTKANVITSSGARPAIRIGNTRFDAALIESVYVKAPTVENLAKVSFNMDLLTNALKEGQKESLGRILLYVGLSMNSLDSEYANPFVYKGKPFYVEFKVFTTTSMKNVIDEETQLSVDKLVTEVDAEKTAKECVRVINKFLLFESDKKLLNAYVGTGASKGIVYIEGTNGYQQIKKAVLQLWNPDAIKVDCCTTNGDFEDVVTGVPVTYTINYTIGNGKEIGAVTASSPAKKVLEDGSLESIDTTTETAITPGIEAFGDYDWIIHNLRLPTYENFNYWSANKQEMPQAGQSYTQFTITMSDTRDRVAGESVGMRTTSVTTHVLYVAGSYLDSNSEAYKVYSALNTLKSSAVHTDADDTNLFA